MRLLKMKNISRNILRIGLAATFLLIGILILKNPESWGGYLQPWAVSLLPISLNQAIFHAAILDLIIGTLLFMNFLPWLAALVGSIHLVLVLIVSGITDITVRDIGLVSAALAVAIDSLPQSIAQRINFLKKF